MILQLSRFAAKVSAKNVFERCNFSSLIRSSVSSCSKATLFCKCISCMALKGHGKNKAFCRCIRCFSTEKPVTPANESVSTTADEKDSKIAQLQDSYLRCLADMENLRQRTKKEVESASIYSIQKFCKDIVSVADVLELALGTVKNDPRTVKLLKGQEEALEEVDTPSDSVDSSGIEVAMKMSKEELALRLQDLSVGLSMTLSELVKVFALHGVTPIDPLHQKFDPNFHMAMYEAPNNDLEAGTVVAVQKKGYLLNHRVIRPASVGVSKKENE